MMRIEQTLSLDMIQGGTCQVVQAKQGDAATRFVRVRITCGGEAYPIPEGVSAHLRCLKPDGRSCINPGEVNEDGTITLELTEQVLAVPGMVWADVCLMGEKEELLSTLSFQIQVDFVPLGLNVSSENEIQTLLELIRQAGKLEGGASAYEIAQQHGFAGTELEWLESLRGLPGAVGPAGPAGADGRDGNDGKDGKDGKDGNDGLTPVRGVDYCTEADMEQMVDDVMAELPVTVAGDGFTDITGLRRLTAVHMTQQDGYITVQTTMSGGKTDSSSLILDEKGYPVKIETGDEECILSWSGFGEIGLDVWEGGDY